MAYSYVLFDLDGTLTDPRIGITKSVQYALRHFGIEEPDISRLNHFIGPPLMESFRKSYGFSEEQGAEAINRYREYFSVSGILENSIYPGIPELLQLLHSRGCRISLATSKPTVYARRILEHFGIDIYFDAIVGSNLDNTRTGKPEIIEAACAELGAPDYSQVIMIGDRRYDIAGAQAHLMGSIGVQYGYGTAEELAAQQPTYTVATVAELTDLLVRLTQV